MEIRRLRVIVLFTIILTIFLTACETNSSTVLNNNTTKISNEDLKKVFEGYSPTLDGAYAESYCSELYDIYKESNMKQFIQVLCEYDINAVKGVMEFLVGELLNRDDGKAQAKELERIFEEMKEDKSLSGKEKYAVYQGLTCILFFRETLSID